MNDRRWGFEELDDGEYEEITRRRPAKEPVETAATVSGQDADAVVTVHVTPDGEVVAVRVAANWKKSVDPRALAPSVLAAANNATLQAMATQLDRAVQQPPAPQQAHIDTIETQQATIGQKVHDIGAEWSPSNIAAMSDASVTDGDAPDWQIIE